MKQLITLALTTIIMSGAHAQTESDIRAQMAQLPWVTAPAEGKIADQATIKLDDKLMFLGDDGTKKFLQLMGNPPRPGHYTVLSNEGDWFAVFSFTPDGFVRDDEKIDADALLKAMKESDGPANEERQRLGMGTLQTLGWTTPPHYDALTKRLEWGVRLRDERGQEAVNYTSRLLGRGGIMSATLVTDPRSLEADRLAFNRALSGFTYNAGRRYAEFREGDKVAAYGLGALVLGGAAAAAAKSGAGKAIAKGAWIAIVAGGAAVIALFKRIFGRREDSSSS